MPETPEATPEAPAEGTESARLEPAQAKPWHPRHGYISLRDEPLTGAQIAWLVHKLGHPGYFELVQIPSPHRRLRVTFRVGRGSVEPLHNYQAVMVGGRERLCADQKYMGFVIRWHLWPNENRTGAEPTEQEREAAVDEFTRRLKHVLEVARKSGKPIPSHGPTVPLVVGSPVGKPRRARN